MSTNKNKKRIFKIVFIIASLCSLFLVPWTLVKAWITPLPDTIQEQVNDVIDYDFKGVIVYVNQAGKPPKHFTSGWHNPNLKTPTRPNALFKIGSIKKLYNAVSVTKLVHNGKLSLDKTIADYLPELNGKIENANQITLRQMVQHRSGLPNYTDTPNFWANPTDTYSESLALILDKPANFKPNSNYEYCNTNYLLINKIMDNVLGYNNFEFLKEEVLKPLHLTHTYNSLSEVNIDDVMSGYHIGHHLDLKNDNFGMLATAEDVGKFLRALNNGTIFKPGEQDIYTAIYKYEHAGWVPGYQSFANYYKDIDTAVIAFYSTTDPKLHLWNLSEIINSRIVKILEKQIAENKI
jgi:D-alanyl-D-alanine carboxypeptidase